MNYEENSKKYKRIKLTEKGIELAGKTVKQIINIENRAFRNIDEKEMSMAVNFLRNQLEILKEETKNELG